MKRRGTKVNNRRLDTGNLPTVPRTAVSALRDTAYELPPEPPEIAGLLKVFESMVPSEDEKEQQISLILKNEDLESPLRMNYAQAWWNWSHDTEVQKLRTEAFSGEAESNRMRSKRLLTFILKNEKCFTNHKLSSETVVRRSIVGFSIGLWVLNGDAKRFREIADEIDAAKRLATESKGDLENSVTNGKIAATVGPPTSKSTTTIRLRCGLLAMDHFVNELGRIPNRVELQAIITAYIELEKGDAFNMESGGWNRLWIKLKLDWLPLA